MSFSEARLTADQPASSTRVTRSRSRGASLVGNAAEPAPSADGAPAPARPGAANTDALPGDEPAAATGEKDRFISSKGSSSDDEMRSDGASTHKTGRTPFRMLIRSLAVVVPVFVIIFIGLQVGGVFDPPGAAAPGGAQVAPPGGASQQSPEVPPATAGDCQPADAVLSPGEGLPACEPGVELYVCVDGARVKVDCGGGQDGGRTRDPDAVYGNDPADDDRP